MLKQSMPCESKNAFLAPFYAQESRRDERKRRFMSIKWRIHLIDGAVQQPPMAPYTVWITAVSSAAKSPRTRRPVSMTSW